MELDFRRVAIAVGRPQVTHIAERTGIGNILHRRRSIRRLAANRVKRHHAAAEIRHVAPLKLAARHPAGKTASARIIAHLGDDVRSAQIQSTPVAARIGAVKKSDRRVIKKLSYPLAIGEGAGRADHPTGQPLIRQHARRQAVGRLHAVHHRRHRIVIGRARRQAIIREQECPIARHRANLGERPVDGSGPLDLVARRIGAAPPPHQSLVRIARLRHHSARRRRVRDRIQRVGERGETNLVIAAADLAIIAAAAFRPPTNGPRHGEGGRQSLPVHIMIPNQIRAGTILGAKGHLRVPRVAAGVVDPGSIPPRCHHIVRVFADGQQGVVVVAIHVVALVPCHFTKLSQQDRIRRGVPRITPDFLRLPQIARMHEIQGIMGIAVARAALVIIDRLIVDVAPVADHADGGDGVDRKQIPVQPVMRPAGAVVVLQKPDQTITKLREQKILKPPKAARVNPRLIIPHQFRRAGPLKALRTLHQRYVGIAFQRYHRVRIPVHVPDGTVGIGRIPRDPVAQGGLVGGTRIPAHGYVVLRKAHAGAGAAPTGIRMWIGRIAGG